MQNLLKTFLSIIESFLGASRIIVDW